MALIYCERAARFCSDFGNSDPRYFGALIRMFEEALKAIGELPEKVAMP
jgi:hypothetical protein